ncbi:MAG TPA: succinate dehydrogenase assembly factor 2 [Rhodocyclaceae bacterium]
MNEQQRLRRERLKWHCRRALLELDIVFQRFWQARGDELDDATATQLERLLELEDHDLWDLISGRTTTEDAPLRSLVESLRGPSAATADTK